MKQEAAILNAASQMTVCSSDAWQLHLLVLPPLLLMLLVLLFLHVCAAS